MGGCKTYHGLTANWSGLNEKRDNEWAPNITNQRGGTEDPRRGSIAHECQVLDLDNNIPLFSLPSDFWRVQKPTKKFTYWVLIQCKAVSARKEAR